MAQFLTFHHDVICASEEIPVKRPTILQPLGNLTLVKLLLVGARFGFFFLIVFLVTFQIKPRQNSSTKEETLSYSTVIP